MKPQKGDKNYHHKLTSEEVMEIRQIWARNMTAGEIAAKYGIAPITVYKVVNDMCWTHLPSVTDLIAERIRQQQEV